MSIIRWSLIAACIAANLSLVPIQAHSLAPVLGKVRDSVVQVESETSWCSGFVVGLTRVISAIHCIENGEEFLVDGKVARIVKKDENFVLFDVGVQDWRPLPLARSYQHGEEVVSLGWRAGLLLIYGRHIATFYEDVIQLDGPITPGMSGGPVVNMAGEVVGLNQGTTTDRGFISPVQMIRKFLK